MFCHYALILLNTDDLFVPLHGHIASITVLICGVFSVTFILAVVYLIHRRQIKAQGKNRVMLCLIIKNYGPCA